MAVLKSIGNSPFRGVANCTFTLLTNLNVSNLKNFSRSIKEVGKRRNLQEKQKIN